MTSSRIEYQPNTRCSCCRSEALDTVFEMPKFPQIAIFAATPAQDGYPTFDQALMICRDCGHIQILNNVDPSFLYNDSFTHRTSASASAMAGNRAFAQFIAQVSGGRQFKRAIEIGCNDTFLLQELLGVVDSAFGVDPVWRGRENLFGSELPEDKKKRISVIGDFVEKVDFAAKIGGKPDLIVSSFVFEHLREPRTVLERLFPAVADDALFVIQVPGTDMLLDNCRFDQLSHQHYQQFTLDSFKNTIELAGGEYIGHHVFYEVWGAIMIAFRRKTGKAARPELGFRRATKELVAERKVQFDAQLNAARRAATFAKPRKVYGLGAAQNFPSLAYFLGDVSFLESILDDSPARQNKFFPGFPVPIKAPDASMQLDKAAIMITAPDYGRVLVRRAAELKAEQLILPVHVI
jgi:hypothetical protein